jgi:hypothetical protein
MLTATELVSAKRYWQVHRNDPARNIHPAGYQPAVVGIIWNTMFEFRTWFGDESHKPYGIQLIPLTPIAEERDDLDWAYEMYPKYAKECSNDCVQSGWSTTELAILATIGQKDIAMQQAIALPDLVYALPAGNGHSVSNTIWYIATRPEVAMPFDISTLDFVPYPIEELAFAVTCARADTCTESALNYYAGGFTCKQRILYFMDNEGLSQLAACRNVATEYPDECSPCDPDGGIGT